MHVATLPYELYVFLKFFERLGMKKLPDSKQLEEILTRCIKSTHKSFVTINNQMSANKSGTNLNGAGANYSEQINQVFLENAAKNYPLINWIKSNYTSEKLLKIIKDYEENMISISNGNPSSIATFLSSLNTPATSAANGSKDSNNKSKSPSPAPSSSSSSSSSTSNETMANSQSTAPIINIENSSEFIYLYLPELYKSSEIKDNLISSVMTLIKNRQIKNLDDESYLAHKLSLSSASTTTTTSSSTSNGKSTSKGPSNNIYDHYRVYNEIILPNLNSLSKNVKDSVVLFSLDHADPKMLEILRDHPCIPVSPYGRRLKKPNKLVHPNGKLALLYLESDERFPYGSEETYLREDRLQILKMLGMKYDHLSWAELLERAESPARCV